MLGIVIVLPSESPQTTTTSPLGVIVIVVVDLPHPVNVIAVPRLLVC